MKLKSKIKENNKQGISLIVLVITIIVMIILAAAVILSLSSNGIIDRANEAIDATDIAQVKNLASSVWADIYLKYIKNEIKKEEIREQVITELEKNNIEVEKYRVTVSENGVDISKKDKSLNHYGTIPEGATMYIGKYYIATENYVPRGDYSTAIATYESGDVFPGSKNDVIEGCPIRFCREYGMESEDYTIKYVFYSNGVFIAHQDGVIDEQEMQILTYDGNEIYLEDVLIGSVSDNGTEITFGENVLKLISDKPSYVGCVYSYEDYEYIYIKKESKHIELLELITGYSWEGFESSWNPYVIDVNKSSYGRILESINGKDITNMLSTYAECTSLINTDGIIIPSTVTYMPATFYGCTSLVDASSLNIPLNAISMHQMFANCTSLTGTITINATPETYGECLKGTGITQILGDCKIKDELLATK